MAMTLLPLIAPHIHRQAELQAAFSEELFGFLNTVFSTFDDAVTRFEMFKYQHVVGLHGLHTATTTLLRSKHFRHFGSPKMLKCADV
jgi:hypothetical protein